jgi:endonuclease/exonuclease/phosphatase family metal-dependent hydrolase
MKKLKFFGRLMFFVNSLAAFLLLISYILPYIPPKSFSTLSVLSLGVPLLILLNILFFAYWLFQVKKQMFLSLVILLLGFNYIGSMYKFSSSKVVEDDKNFTVMSYNVRSFNIFNWLPNNDVKGDIKKLILSESPDIISLQEYSRGSPLILDDYYNYNARYTNSARGGQAIFSKFPIVNTGSLEFPNTKNNVIFADIIKKGDTIRVYNIHLQSAGITKDVNELDEESSGRIFKQVGKTFKAQQDQVELFLKHKSRCSYKTIVAGDFNNSAFSYVYKAIKGEDLSDSFEKAGNGFGKTFDFKYFPLRIDFILADKQFEVNGFKTFNDIKLSDHYPIVATLNLD